MNMLISPASTHSHKLRDPLGQLYCSKHCTMASENTGLIQQETDSEEEEEWIIQARLQSWCIRMVMQLTLDNIGHKKVINMISLLLDYVIKQLIMCC